MKLRNLKTGDKLIAGGGFICLIKGQIYKVIKGADGALFVRCNSGYHYLDSHINKTGELIGFTKVKDDE